MDSPPVNHLPQPDGNLSLSWSFQTSETIRAAPQSKPALDDNPKIPHPDALHAGHRILCEEDETMTFVLALFASLISAMFIATFASSVIASSREARDEMEHRRLRVF
jgi:hypothetical protein